MTTTMHGVAKSQQQEKLRKSLRRLYVDPAADFKSVPSNYDHLDQQPYHASVTTANAIYDRLIKGDAYFTALPWKGWQLEKPRLHCHSVGVQLALGFNRHGYLRVAKSTLGHDCPEQLMTAALSGFGRYAYRKLLSGPRRKLYVDWFKQLKAANATKEHTVRRHFARSFLQIYEALCFEDSLKGQESLLRSNQMAERERINRAGKLDDEPSEKMRRLITRFIMQLLGEDP